jgi:Glutamyl-tRNAGlu reductase, N-terminal domain/Tetrahydrofolate dehydrogenase/cyclohydrolase, NAD(P)-binding domain
VASDATDGAARAHGRVPVVVVGASYKDASTDVRARLSALEQSEDPPSRALVNGGWAEAVVPVETCSRIEWVISSNNPDFAADLLAGALVSRVPEAHLHKRTGSAAVHYLMRVAMGLDSVAEGEPAVGRQVARAFELAHVDGRTDGALRQLWRALQQLLAERRKRGLVTHGLGVQSLVVDALSRRAIDSGAVSVFGQGEIGRAVAQALRDRGFTVSAHRRATWDAFVKDAERARAVVVCTGAPARFVELPARGAHEGAVVVDVGSPQQTKSAPGWEIVTLEELLSEPRAQLPDEAREWLTHLIAQAADRTGQDLAAPPPKGALGVIDEERKVFLREKLPEVLAGLPPAQAEQIRRACAAFAHTLMERVREVGVASEETRAPERSQG